MKCKAYWLHIDGEIIPVATTHIASVIKNPEHFGYSLERIEAEYSEFKEPVGHEGKARQLIMADLIQNHEWIRVRYNPRHDLWVVEAGAICQPLIQLLQRFFSDPEIIGSCPHAFIKITDLCPQGENILNYSTTVSDICRCNWFNNP